jgi:glycogen(starch) synthase
MRVLMTADTIGGVWTYALELARALAPHGVEVHLATLGRLPDEEQRRAASNAGIAELSSSAYRLEWEDDPWEDVDRAGAWLLDLEEQLRPDVVHLNGYAHGCLPWQTPVMVVAHSDVVSWWWAVHGCAPPERYDRYRSAVEAGLRAATVVVAPTAAVLRDLERHYHFRTERIVVHNASGASFPAIGKEPLVAGLGRFWDEAKNVAALEAVGTKLPWPLELAGAGTARGRATPGEVTALLARAAVFAAPARYEPFGLAILEAARAGCALVLGDIASLREVWGEAAVFAPPDDEAALLAALRLVTGDDALRTELAARAKRRAERYVPERMGRAYDDLYRRLPALVTA